MQKERHGSTEKWHGYIIKQDQETNKRRETKYEQQREPHVAHRVKLSCMLVHLEVLHSGPRAISQHFRVVCACTVLHVGRFQNWKDCEGPRIYHVSVYPLRSSPKKRQSARASESVSGTDFWCNMCCFSSRGRFRGSRGPEGLEIGKSAKTGAGFIIVYCPGTLGTARVIPACRQCPLLGPLAPFF